jgi:hypothetical protein
MIKTLILSAVLVASIAAAQAQTKEPTNSGTSSYLAELVRAKAATRQDRSYQPKATLPANWAQDHWR